MTAYDEMWWRDSTPAGRLYTRLNIPTRRSLDDIDAEIEARNAEYRERFERDLTEEERSEVRAGAQRRVSPAFTGELTLQDVADLGWGFQKVHEPAGDMRGIAVQYGPGDWRGDPAIVPRARVGEELRDARIRDAQAMGWPGRPRGVA